MMMISLFFVLLTGPALADTPAPSPLCGAAETTEFSCTLSDSRPLAFCATADHEEVRGEVSLHIGAGPTAIVQRSASSAFVYDRYTRPMTTYLSIGFTQESADWTVYDESVNDERAAGLRAGELDIKCGEIVGSLMRLEDNLRR